ncbi:hypothetical protein Tco_0653803 [Tanacetum coccineum]|uniref:Uncharacterized protein n=1 Tax=Tanacetum coccineum TaxID=301880 RepID=A0ABQ4X1K5_9ASTR
MCPPAFVSPAAELNEYSTYEDIFRLIMRLKSGHGLPVNVLSDVDPYQYTPSNLPVALISGHFFIRRLTITQPSGTEKHCRTTTRSLNDGEEDQTMVLSKLPKRTSHHRDDQVNHVSQALQMGPDATPSNQLVSEGSSKDERETVVLNDTRSAR